MPNNNIKDVAKNIITISNDMGFKITNLKLNNLLYIVQCESYRRCGEPMFVEDLYACEIGVRNTDIYRYYLGYGASNIPKEEYTPMLPSQDTDILVDIIEITADANVWTIVDIVKNTTPWDFMWKIFRGKFPIHKQMMKNTFWENKSSFMELDI